MIMRRLAGVLAGLIVSTPSFLAGELHARDYCPPCMEQALTQQGEGILDNLDKLVKQYRALGGAPAIDAILARGTPQQKAAAREFLVRWREAKLLASTYNNPELVRYLQNDRDRQSRVVQEREAEFRRQSELIARLMRTNIEPERQSVMRDLASYEKEAAELKKMFATDVGIGALRGVAAGVAMHVNALAAAVGKGGDIGQAAAQFERALMQERVVVSIELTGDTAHNQHTFRQMSKDKNRVGQVAVVAGAASEAGLALMHLMSRQPQAVVAEVHSLGHVVAHAAAARAPLYSTIVALTLDNVLLQETLVRQSQAEVRLADVTYNVGLARLEARRYATKVELDAHKKGLDLIDKDIVYQRKIAAFARSVDEWQR